ncbi:LOW QUALITY PROTEIN: probable polypeptide N-acetylgalactosaminyltransferase 8 [Grammomys surdaster]|uniref:LOW QUALITY PROTEIN: probable polypeptide N-acetylgalactosaminyltransferase 8 n=1 Tax=Grammomys surdaster TaxID=491861 RepID=UPI00109FDA46|nr:LOW QUALITY PROTEIN: probable polypeptide N-acetylgalactosaminyltransferase 8 [Grammomys surdaster]
MVHTYNSSPRKVDADITPDQLLLHIKITASPGYLVSKGKTPKNPLSTFEKHQAQVFHRTKWPYYDDTVLSGQTFHVGMWHKSYRSVFKEKLIQLEESESQVGAQETLPKLEDLPAMEQGALRGSSVRGPDQNLLPEFGHNVLLSNQWPYNRNIPDAHDACIATVVRQPAQLDENFKLYNQNYPILLKLLIRHIKRRGPAQARNTDLEAVVADVVAILDAHGEVNTGWTDPTLALIQEEHTVVVSLVFDNINFNTFELEKYELAADGFGWMLCPIPQAWIDLGDVTVPLKSPSIMGILGANRIFSAEVRALDGGRLLCGGQNVELSLRCNNIVTVLDSKAMPGSLEGRVG